jgi:hypothetical protein
LSLSWRSISSRKVVLSPLQQIASYALPYSAIQACTIQMHLQWKTKSYWWTKRRCSSYLGNCVTASTTRRPSPPRQPERHLRPAPTSLGKGQIINMRLLLMGGVIRLWSLEIRLQLQLQLP